MRDWQSQRSAADGQPSILKWRSKFSAAIAGCMWALRTQNSFHAHLFVAAVVIIIASTLQLPAWRWSVLLLAISSVMAAEMINTSIECLVSVLHPDHDPIVGRSLDVAAGAVLIAAIFAAVVGLIILLGPVIDIFLAVPNQPQPI